LQSLSQLTTGHHNTSVGYQSLAANTDGTSNSGFGFGTLGSNTQGTVNTAMGINALHANTLGGNNTALGGMALLYNTTAGNNTAIGINSLNQQSYNNSGTAWNSDNVAVGYQALFSNQPTSTSTGVGNTAVGDNAMDANTTGYHNTAIGYFSDVVSGALYNTFTAGYNATATASNQVRLGDANIASLFCLGAYAATSAATPNLVTDVNGQIMRSTASVPTGTGTATRVAFWNTASSLGSNANLYWDDANSRLGIGTTLPSQQLELTGSMIMPTTTSSSTGVIYKGSFSFLHNFSPGGTGYNIFLGESAGNFTMSGSPPNACYNIGIGLQSLSQLTTGHHNTSIGYQSLSNNTDGVSNSGFGFGTLGSNNSGNVNTAAGINALHFNTFGGDNTAMGGTSLYNNTTAGSNTAIGSTALYIQSYNNGGAAWNSFNVAVGYSALYQNQPTSVTTGYRNTAVGAYAMNANSTGYQNTAIGYDADVGSGALYNTVAVGYNTIATASNQVRLGDANITSFFCQGAYATTSAATPNLVTDVNGQIMRSTASIPTGTGTATRVAFWSTSSSLGSNANLYWDDANSRLGIGTISPNQQLELTGNLRLPVTTAIAGIIYAGAIPYIHNFGSNNNFMGENCGNLTLSGATSNSAIGDSALMNITSGDRNIAFGQGALKAVTSSTGNIAIGYGAGRGITTAAGYNTIIGYQAGTINNTDRNTFLGCETGYSNTTGHYDVFIGHQAGFGNTTAHNSVGIGYRALYSQTGDAGTNALNNTAVGYQALYFNNPTTTSDGRENVAVGSQALQNNTTGYYNTSVGSGSLLTNNTGYNNTAIGYNSDVGSAALSNTVAIGYNATATTSNQVRLGDANITSLFCQGAYTATSAATPNLVTDINGQIMRSTASLATGSGTATRVAFWSTSSGLSSNGITQIHG
jgi:hypothetical protein